VARQENGALHGRRRQTIVESLLADVCAGKLRAGRRLGTRELAERFGVSHTPIREALIALSGIGVVDLLPNRGAIVRQVNADEVREICEVRCVMECEATRLACGRIGLHELHALAEALRALQASQPHGGHAGSVPSSSGHASSVPHADGDGAKSFIDRARAVDNRLHDLIASSCGNRFLAQEISRLKVLFRAFRDISWEQEEARNDYHRLAEEAGEHLAIVQALICGRADLAVKAMAHHIRTGGRYWGRAVPVNGEASRPA
jgi:DNA-binding GntR family transcriptional regulator